MKNTLENKVIFSAQYWWQRVAKYPDSEELIMVGSDFMFAGAAGRGFLELKPLSQITDEDADFCLKEMGMPYRDDIVYNASKFRRVVLDKRMRTIDAATVDHLRSKGYALPWLGISVEEQIEFGWVKLKE